MEKTVEKLQDIVYNTCKNRMKRADFMVEKVLYQHQIYHFGVVNFQHLNIFPTRSAARIPAGCQCALAMVFPYCNKSAFCGNISAYCAVADYHIVVGEQLKSICRQLKEIYPQYRFVPFVDASPVDEVDMCVKAGLGVRGRNSLLITPWWGSFVFIGEILTDMPMECVCREEKGCIGCGRCERACPGGALSGGRVNRDRCASAISQKKGRLSDEETAILKKSGCVFGCDICQTVCPMNKGKECGENMFSGDIISTITRENVENLYKKRAFGFRGLKVLQRNLDILCPPRREDE